MKRDHVRQLFQFSIFEIVFICVVSVALGVFFWGWTFVYDITKPFLKPFGLNYLTSGFWIMASVFLSYIVRRPGVAIIASLLASFVEGFLAHWGLAALIYGLIQGIAAEVIFAAFLYKRWSFSVVLLASLSSSFCSYAYDYLAYDYQSLDQKIVLIQLSSFLISSCIFSAWLSIHIADRLIKNGLLKNMKIAKK